MAVFLDNVPSEYYKLDPTYPTALAAMCIITSFVHLADFIFGLINLKNQEIEFNIRNITSQVIKIPVLVSPSIF